MVESDTSHSGIGKAAEGMVVHPLNAAVTNATCTTAQRTRTLRRIAGKVALRTPRANLISPTPWWAATRRQRIRNHRRPCSRSALVACLLRQDTQLPPEFRRVHTQGARSPRQHHYYSCPGRDILHSHFPGRTGSSAKWITTNDLQLNERIQRCLAIDGVGNPKKQTDPIRIAKATANFRDKHKLPCLICAHPLPRRR
jgi:hypothetical protein